MGAPGQDRTWNVDMNMTQGGTVDGLILAF